MNENTAAMIQTFIPMVLILVVFYFFLIRPQKKREKETQEMPVGGIIGTVVSMREDHLVIETGSDRSKIRITRWAVQMNNTSHEKASSKSK